MGDKIIARIIDKIFPTGSTVIEKDTKPMQSSSSFSHHSYSTGNLKELDDAAVSSTQQKSPKSSPKTSPKSGSPFGLVFTILCFCTI